MKKYYTFVDNSDKMFGNNAYVRGRIAGFMLVICGNQGPGFTTIGGDVVLVCKTVAPLYWLFKHVVEKHYPGLCRFNCSVKKEQES